MRSLFERYLCEEPTLTVGDTAKARHLRKRLSKAYRARDWNLVDELEDQLERHYEDLEHQMQQVEYDYENLSSEDDVDTFARAYTGRPTLDADLFDYQITPQSAVIDFVKRLLDNVTPKPESFRQIVEQPEKFYWGTDYLSTEILAKAVHDAMTDVAMSNQGLGPGIIPFADLKPDQIVDAALDLYEHHLEVVSRYK